MKKLAMLTMLIFLSLSADEAFGCVCAFDSNPTPEKSRAERRDALEKATAVFTGEVIALDILTVKFKVDKIWKGGEAKEITMLTGTKDNGDGTFSYSSCDYSFNKGQKYLVYAYGPPEELKTHACARTSQLQYAEEEAKGLDEITPHKAVGAEPGQGEQPRFN